MQARALAQARSCAAHLKNRETLALARNGSVNPMRDRFCRAILRRTIRVHRDYNHDAKSFVRIDRLFDAIDKELRNFVCDVVAFPLCRLTKRGNEELIGRSEVGGGAGGTRAMHACARDSGECSEGDG